MSADNPHGFSARHRRLLDEARESAPVQFAEHLAQFEAGEISRGNFLWLCGDNNAEEEHVELYPAAQRRYPARPSSLRGNAGHRALVALARAHGLVSGRDLLEGK